MPVTNIRYICYKFDLMSIAESVLKRIEALPRGEMLLAADFSDLGSSEAVRLSLFRLEKEGAIRRVSHGIYVRPKESSYLGKIVPSAEEVAAAIAKRDRIRTVPTGSYALNALGLSTQVPMNIVLLTDGSPREIKVGRRKIKFKRTTPKNLMAKGKVSGLVIQALKEIGNGRITEAEERKIIDLLCREEEKDLRHDIVLAPVWVQKIMKKALNGG